MVIGLLTGAGVGLGAWALVRGLAPPRPRLVRALGQIERPGAGPGGASLARALVEAMGVDLGRLRHDLRVVGRLPERHALDKVMAALALAVLPVASAALLGAGGVHAPGGAVVAASATLAVAGFVAPDLVLRSESATRRREFRHALGAYLDLVAIVVAGGGGTETALYSAADAGDGWAFTELRRTLGGCRLSGEPPWVALERLGEDLAVDELREIAAGVALAGEHGAKVRQSLAARAATLRDHRLAEVESDAQAATEKMSVPVVLMLFGFVAFVMYPALRFVLEGL